MSRFIVNIRKDFLLMNENNVNFHENNGVNYDNQNINEEAFNQERRRVAALRVQRPTITYILIAINIAMWAILNLISFKTGKSYNELIGVFGAKININILRGQYWRFITPIFLHADITHLLVNCYSLNAVGQIVERIYGHAKFLLIYLVAGIMGNILSFMFSINPAVGASGAIFGLLGALLYLGVEHPKFFRAYFGRSIFTTIAINLGYGFLNTGIDNFGHIGGLIGGFFASGIVKAPIKGKWYMNKVIYIILFLAIGVSGLIYGFNCGNNIALVKLDELYRHDANQNWNEAANIGEEILEQKPTDKNINIEVLWMTTKAEAVIGNYNKAVEHGKALVKLSPKDGHYLLGIVYYDMGQLELSREELQKAKALNASYSNIDELIRSIESR
ncbi:rhomboid family intramembrane serine protease [Proteiniborus sp. MB09-C3]|uniref:rhomboid family intramembrane serine protease n=1 Tax=Proteiniborus sp. MB09-C3 TaxID=3050072 RepID=UPI002554133D|nr:rhomboid family intramembrane serine protease [Proteiniborus sp. MB09-C3]WIV13485.1 rhomboid family intramembrane serine protease [Proteiniborus sp. MB09-C3]